MKTHDSTIRVIFAAFALFATLAAAKAAPTGDNSQCEPAGEWNQTDAYRSINGIPAGNNHECQYEYRSDSTGAPARGPGMAHDRTEQ